VLIGKDKYRNWKVERLNNGVDGLFGIHGIVVEKDELCNAREVLLPHREERRSKIRER
jgi:hypothetical protein